MSTPRKIDSRTAAKRRAARRKRTREALGRFLVILIVLILVLGTASIAIVSQPTATVVAPTAVAQPQPTANSQAQTLLTQGNQAYAAQSWQTAIQYYTAYLGLDPNGYSNPDLHFYLGKSYLNVQPPQYLNGVSELQQALNINPNASWAQEAHTLIDQNKDKVPLTPSVVITGTASITGTAGTAGTPAPAAIKGTATTVLTSTTAPATKVP